MKKFYAVGRGLQKAASFLIFYLTIIGVEASFAVPAQSGVAPLCERGPNSGIFTHVYKFETPGGQYLELEYNSVLGWRFLEDAVKKIGDNYFYFSKNKDCAEALVAKGDGVTYNGSRTGIMFRKIGSGNGWLDRHEPNGTLTRFQPTNPENPIVSLPLRILKQGLQTFFFRDVEQSGIAGALTSVEINRPLPVPGETTTNPPPPPPLPGQFKFEFSYTGTNLSSVTLKSSTNNTVLKTWHIKYNEQASNQLTEIELRSAEGVSLAKETFTYFAPPSSFAGLIKTVVLNTGGKKEINYSNLTATPFKALFTLRIDPYKYSASTINQDYQPTFLKFTYTALPPNTPDSKFYGFNNVKVEINSNPIWRKEITMIEEPSGVRSLISRVVTKGKNPPTSTSDDAFQTIEDLTYSYTTELGDYTPPTSSNGNPPHFVALTKIEGHDHNRPLLREGTYDFILHQYTQTTSRVGLEPAEITERVYLPTLFEPHKPFFMNLEEERVYKGELSDNNLISRKKMEYTTQGYLTSYKEILNEVEANETRYSMHNRLSGLPSQIDNPDGSTTLTRFDGYFNIKNLSFRSPNIAYQNAPKVVFSYNPVTFQLKEETHNYNNSKFEYSYDSNFRLAGLVKKVGGLTVLSKQMSHDLDGVTSISSNNLITVTQNDFQQKILSLDGFGNLNGTATRITPALYAAKATMFNRMGNPEYTTLRPFITENNNFQVKTLSADETGGGVLDRQILDFKGTYNLKEIKSGGPVAMEYLNGLQFASLPGGNGIRVFYNNLANHEYFLTHDEGRTSLKYTLNQPSIGHNQAAIYTKGFTWKTLTNGMRITDTNGYEIRNTIFDLAGRLFNFKSVGLPELRYSYANSENNRQVMWKEFGEGSSSSRVEDIFEHGKLIERNYGQSGSPGSHSLRLSYDGTTKTKLIEKSLLNPDINSNQYWSSWGHIFRITGHDHNNRMTSSTEVNPATNGQVNCEYRWTEDGKLTEFYVKLFEGVNLGFKVSYDKHSGEISDIIIPNLSQQPAIKYDNLGTDKISRIEHPLNGDIFDLTYLRGELQKISSSSTDSGREELELVYSDLFGGLGEWRFRTNEYPIPGEFFQRVTRRGPGGAPLTIETDSLGNNNPSGNQVINITYDPEDGRLLSFQRNLNPTVNFTYDPEDKYKPISSSAAGLSYPLEYNSLRQTVTYQAPYEEMIRTELTPTGHQRKLSIAEATGITYLNIIPSVHDGNLPFGVVYEKFNLSDGEHSGSWQLNFGEFNYCGGLFRTISTVEHVQQGNVFHAFINHLKGYLYIPGLRVSGDSLGLYRGWIGMLEFDLDTHILAALSAHQNSSPPYYPAPVKSTIFPLYKDFVDKVNVISRDIDQAIPNDLIYPNPHDPDLSYKTASGRDMIQKNPAEMTIDQLYRVSEKALRVDNYIQELLPALNTKFVPGVEPGHLATGMIERFYEPRDVLSAINQINDESSSRVNSKLNTYDKFNYSSGKTAFTGESAIENYLEQYTKSGLPKGSDNNYILGILGYNHLKDLRWRTVNPYQSTRKELLE